MTLKKNAHNNTSVADSVLSARHILSTFILNRLINYIILSTSRMPIYKYLNKIYINKRTRNALQNCVDWLPNMHFKLFGSCELCDKTEILQRKTLNFLIKIGKE